MRYHKVVISLQKPIRNYHAGDGSAKSQNTATGFGLTFEGALRDALQFDHDWSIDNLLTVTSNEENTATPKGSWNSLPPDAAVLVANTEDGPRVLAVNDVDATGKPHAYINDGSVFTPNA